MTDGLRPPIPYTIRLVDAAHFNVDRCVSCGRKLTRRVDAYGRAFYWETDHEPWCGVRMLR